MNLFKSFSVFILSLSLLSLVPAHSQTEDHGFDAERKKLLIMRNRAENINDQAEVARIDASLEEIDHFLKNRNKSPFVVLADPDDKLYTYVLNDSMVFPSPMPDDLAELLPERAGAGWRLVSFSELTSKLKDKVALLSATMGTPSAAAPSGWSVPRHDLNQIIAPSDKKISPKIAIYIHPQLKQPMTGVSAVDTDPSTGAPH